MKPKAIRRPYPNLAAYRDANGLSQREAADKFGVSQGTWQKWEAQITAPRKPYRAKLMAETGVPLEVLMGIAS